MSPFNNHASKSQDNDENVISNGNDDNNTGNKVIGNNEDSLKDIFVNELLTYISFYMNNSNINNIKKIASNFYTADEVIESIKMLWNISGNDLKKYTERRNTDQRSCTEANLNDIMDALLQLDAKSKLPFFVARNVERVPDRQPEEINLLSIINRMNKLENMMNDCTDILSSVNRDIVFNKNQINECEQKILKNDECVKCLFDEIKNIKSDIDYKDKKSINSRVSSDKTNESNENLLNMKVLPENDTIEKVELEKNTEVSNQPTCSIVGSDDDLDFNNNDYNLIDEDLLERFNKLRYSDDTSYTKNNSLSLEEFEQFLDSFDKNNKLSASVNEFIDRRLMSNDTLCSKNHENKIMYSEVVKTPDKIIHRNNEKHLRPNVKIKLNDNIYHSPKKIIDGEGFQLIESRSAWNKRKQLYREKFNLKGDPISHVDVWIFKITEGNCEDVVSYLKSYNVDCYNIERSSHSDAKFKSFKVTICKSDLDTIMNKSFWPFGVRCKIWKNRESRNARTVSFIGSKYRNADRRNRLVNF